MGWFLDGSCNICIEPQYIVWICGQVMQYSNSIREICIYMKKKNKKMNMTLGFEA